MQILAVELENVKSYERAEIKFTPGVNAIVGHNGTGRVRSWRRSALRSLILLTITSQEFIRAGSKSAPTRVTLVSALMNGLMISSGGLAASAHYIVFDPNWVRICEGKADVLRFLRQHLKVETGSDLSSILKDAVGVPQGTLTAAFLLARRSASGSLSRFCV